MADRQGRIWIFEETMALCKSHRALVERIGHSIRGQEITWQEDPLPAGGPRYAKPAALVLSPRRTFEAARAYANRGKRVCALNFASSVTPGGGVTRGSGAQEESLCRVSTLYAAISDPDTAGPFYERHRQMIRDGAMGRENRDDCIFTPGVVVIREDTFDCALLPESDWYGVDVITCAAPDLRCGGGVVYRPTAEALVSRFEERWRRILSVAAAHGAEALILGAFGCGAFGNPPEVAVQAFNNVCGEYLRCFETIEFAVFTDDVDGPNYAAFRGIRGIAEAGRPANGPANGGPAASEEALAWHRLLSLTDLLNRRVKEPGWRAEDRQTVYRLKDRMLEKLLTKRPKCVETALFLVPYVQYSQATKDRAGELMRRDRSQYSFEYYLTQVQPGPGDVEIPDRAMVELLAACLGETYSFHMPVQLAPACGIDPQTLPRKPWIAAPEFHHNLLAQAEPVLSALLDEVG